MALCLMLIIPKRNYKQHRKPQNGIQTNYTRRR